MKTQLIPLSKLEKSPLNVRKTLSKAADAELKANILALGLINPLTVTEHKGGKFHVIAGGRRLAALQALQKDGDLPEKYGDGIPCQLAANDDAAELSLAENVVRQAMHPADQFDAFKALVDSGKSVKDVALSFGVTQQLVEKRLALARVAPELMAAYRADKLTLECLMGFTITDDHKRQIKVFKGLSDWQRKEGNAVRRMLSDHMPEASCPEALFVGLEAYKKAGGTVRVDLFDDENEGYIESPEILQRLVQEKLEAAAERLKKKGWAWAELPPESYDERYRYGSINTKKDGTYDAKQMQTAGCFVTISHDGKLHIIEGRVRPQDKKALTKAAKPRKAEAKADQACRPHCCSP
jgi:ParB family transcriptional regulator, chromosome partitioning protein